jgi:hypothetical protein
VLIDDKKTTSYVNNYDEDKSLFITPIAKIQHEEIPVLTEKSFDPPKKEIICKQNQQCIVKERPSENIKMPVLTTFYVGSISIIGLFIIFRMIQTSK